MNEVNTEKIIEDFGKRVLGDVKVLMVEDDTFFSELVLTKLSQFGCVPYSTASGDEAVNLARQYTPDVIILDLMLPGLQGEDVIKNMKQDSDLKDIPIVVFSNKSDQKDIDNVLSLGATKFLIKSSTDLNEVTDIIKDVVSK